MYKPYGTFRRRHPYAYGAARAAVMFTKRYGKPAGAAGLAYLARGMRYSGGPTHQGLGPQGFTSGGAAPITKAGPSKAQRRRYRAKRSRCRKMKGVKLSKEVCKMKNQIKDLRLAENASLGLFTHKVFYSEQVATDTDGKLYGISTGTGFDMGRMVDSVQYLKYYNPAVPGTLTVANFETGTYDRRVLFKTAYFSGLVRNNYQTDVKLRMYLVKPKQSSSISPTTAWQNGIDSNGDASLTTYTQIGQLPNDFSDFRDTWTAKLLQQQDLSPGESVKVSHAENNIEFDPSAYDQHTAAYQSRYKNFHLLLVIEGTLGHSQSAATDGLCQAGVDVMWTRKVVVQYDAGVNLNFIKVENNMDTMTNPVQSHQPIPDNIAYSKA